MIELKIISPLTQHILAYVIFHCDKDMAVAASQAFTHEILFREIAYP